MKSFIHLPFFLAILPLKANENTMSKRYEIKFIEGGVGVFEALMTGGIAVIVEKALDTITNDNNHGWYCIITDKETDLKMSCWGSTKEEAQELTFHALKQKIEEEEEEENNERKKEEEYQRRIQEQKEKEAAEYRQRIQRERQSVPQSSGGSAEDILFQLLAKVIGFILVVAAILWLFLAVAVPLILINIATITLIAGLTKDKWKIFLFSFSVLGAIFIVIDYNMGWFTKALVQNVSFFEGLIPLFFYLNIATGLVAVYFLIRDYLNSKSEPLEGAGEFSKRNLIVMGSLMLVGGITVGLQKYFDAQKPQLTELITNPTPSNPKDIIQSTPTTGYVQTKEGSTLRLRSAPSEKATILNGIPNGSTVEIIDYDDHFTEVNGEKGKWCKVNFNGTIGWAWGGFIKIGENSLTSLPGRFPQASEKLLNADELSRLNKDDLKIMRNEIFARHGYIFKTPEMKSYFATQSWYRGQYEDVTSMLSNIEKQNVEFIKKHE